VQFSKKDIFAAIGIGRLEGEGVERPKKIVSLPKPPRIKLEASKSKSFFRSLVPKEKVDAYQSFRTALETLKEKYTPFLKEYVFSTNSFRTSMILRSFIFKYSKIISVPPAALKLINLGWQELEAPDIRGPEGRWIGIYKTSFTPLKKLFQFPKQYLKFEAVDYKCRVFLNGSFVGTHEGFFAPFEFDITAILKRGVQNQLLVEIENDFPTLKNGSKLYAATGFGWDEPEIGWHHCPGGAGITGKVSLDGRENIFIDDLFIRPDIDNNKIEVWIDIINQLSKERDIIVVIDILPRNFKGCSINGLKLGRYKLRPGLNHFKIPVILKKYRLWQIESPCLYLLKCSLHGNKLIDQKTRSFGMRKFHMDEKNIPRGTFYLNNHQVVLRGANTMGHLQWAAIKNNYTQLIEDILIAKLANLNFYRFTQSPLPEVVYDYMDRLGMLNQTDFPLFGFLRRGKMEEAIKQVGEMEKYIRSHPSTIITSLINEPYGIKAMGDKVRLHYTPKELDEFFHCSCSITKLYNPDRVVKLIEGIESCGYISERDTPWGIQDVHYYSGWYGPGAAPIDGLYSGELFSVKEGWKVTCGEYGSEALDSWETMLKFYPKRWIPKNLTSKWKPDKIPMCQQLVFHFNWFDTPETVQEWIKKSQKHQAIVTRLMTDAFRLRTDLVVGTAIHLLIDAFPAGWLKSVVGVDRKPKPAYYELRDSLTPLAVNIREPRRFYYSGDKLDAQFFIFNDTEKRPDDLYLYWSANDNGEILFENFKRAKILPFAAIFQGYFNWKTPYYTTRKTLRLYLALINKKGEVLHDHNVAFEIFPSLLSSDIKIGIMCHNYALIDRLRKYYPQTVRIKSGKENIDVLILENPNINKKIVKEIVGRGIGIILVNQDKACEWELGSFKTKVIPNSRGLDFVSRKTGHPIVNQFKAEDFAYWFDYNKRRRDFILEYIYNKKAGLKMILKSGEYPAVFETRWKKSIIIGCQIKLFDKIGLHPVATLLFNEILNYLVNQKRSILKNG